VCFVFVVVTFQTIVNFFFGGIIGPLGLFEEGTKKFSWLRKKKNWEIRKWFLSILFKEEKRKKSESSDIACAFFFFFFTVLFLLPIAVFLFFCFCFLVARRLQHHFLEKLSI
jgi:hypothetical protein